MSLGLFYPPIAKNEQILTYAPGTNERSQLKQALDDVAKEQIEITTTQQDSGGITGQIAP